MIKTLKSIDMYDVYQKWLNGTGAFRCFLRSTNFVSLKHYPSFDILESSFEDKALLEKLDAIIKKHDKKTTLFVLDLPNTLSIDAAYFFNKNRALKPIITFNNILHPFGLIGSKEYISKLVNYGQDLNCNNILGFIFILDQNRYGDYDEVALRKNFNNQYELTEEDLPSLEMLSDLEYQSLLYVHIGEAKEDISEYLNYLIENNFHVIKEEL